MRAPRPYRADSENPWIVTRSERAPCTVRAWAAVPRHRPPGRLARSGVHARRVPGDHRRQHGDRHHDVPGNEEHGGARRGDASLQHARDGGAPRRRRALLRAVRYRPGAVGRAVLPGRSPGRRGGPRRRPQRDPAQGSVRRRQRGGRRVGRVRNLPVRLGSRRGCSGGDPDGPGNGVRDAPVAVRQVRVQRPAGGALRGDGDVADLGRRAQGSAGNARGGWRRVRLRDARAA